MPDGQSSQKACATELVTILEWTSAARDREIDADADGDLGFVAISGAARQ
jgi:hypothetical protein